MSLSSSESLLTEDGVICQSDYTEVCTYILPLSLLSNDPRMNGCLLAASQYDAWAQY